MSSAPPGMSTSGVEITNISLHGVWLLAGKEEHFLCYTDFPWFKDATVAKILSVKESTPGHFYWSELDVDLGLETIRHPDRFPLRARHKTYLGDGARASTLRQVLTHT